MTTYDPKRIPLKPAKESLKDIVQWQLTRLALFASNRLLDEQETKLLEAIVDVSKNLTPEELSGTQAPKGKSKKTTASVESLLKIVDK